MKKETMHYEPIKEVISKSFIKRVRAQIKYQEGKDDDCSINCQELAVLRKKNKERQKEIDLYYELLWAVNRKFPNETRHETALRYIKEMENKVNIGGELDSEDE